MSSSDTIAVPNSPGSAGFRALAARTVRAAMEGLVLLLVCLTPWAFGCVHPANEFLLDAGLAVLLVLWAAHVLLTSNVPTEFCPVSFCLAGLLLLGLWQITPLSRPTLAWISPGTAALYHELLPAAPEQLPDGEQHTSTARPGSTISLNPAATRAEVVRLLGMLALFIVVRTSLASAAAFRRLCIVALVNATALALFALVQSWTAPANVAYWSYRTVGWVFGPFINHNHAAGYLNLCLGLGVGLLFARFRRGERGQSWVAWLDGPTLAMLFALALILSTIALSRSRGALLAFIVAGACLALGFKRSGRGRLTAILLLFSGLALALLIWFGMEPMLNRFGDAWENADSRLGVWSRTLPVALKFPIWGTGYGTFASVELTQRTDIADQRFVFSHAHNEYVEALVEGGVIRLLLTFGAVGFVLRAGYRLLNSAGSGAADLALGGLFAVGTVVIHSFVEFGPHIPAIAVLTAVICAQLVGCERGCATLTAVSGTSSSRQGLIGMLAALTAVGVGLVVAAAGWKAYRVDRLVLLARHAPNQQTVPSAEAQIQILEIATRLAPEDASVQYELAEAYLRKVEEQHEELLRQRLVDESVQAVLALAPSGPAGEAHPALTSVPAWLALVQARQQLLEAEERPSQSSVRMALRHVLRSRDADPLLSGPHLLLATHQREFSQADSALAYLDRAKRLAPANPSIQFQIGLQHLLALRVNAACAAWRRSLELSDRHLPDVLKVSAPTLPPSVILNRIVPEKPEQMLAAVAYLLPGDDADAARRPYLEDALGLLAHQPLPLSGRDLHTKAQLHAALKQAPEALAAYQAALDLAPQEADWRFERAKLLQEQKNLPEARRELLQVLSLQPGHVRARTLLEAVARQLAESK